MRRPATAAPSLAPAPLVPALLAALLLLAPMAQASAMWMYRADPVEHDAQGSVPEPDGLTTGVLGPHLANCVLDLPPFEGRCAPDPVPKPGGAIGSVIAPGCTGASGERRLDGQCGLATVGAHGIAAGTTPAPVAAHGMAGNAAPGAYTPTKGSVVRFLDGRLLASAQLPAGPIASLDLPRRASEAGRLAGAGLPAPEGLPGQRSAWAWYGQWADLNGNGVVDHQAHFAHDGGMPNEFQWLGSCTSSDGDRHAAAIQAGACLEDPHPHLVPPGRACEDPESLHPCAGTTLHGWMFPGNHHAAGPLDDVPGRQVARFALRGLDCAMPPTCDDEDRDLGGDPLLGRQGESRPDLAFRDATGDDLDAMRGWQGGAGWTLWAYDEGLLATSVQAWGVNCAPSATSPHLFALASCTFLDVDRQHGLSPATEELLLGDPQASPDGGLKGSARGPWVLARDGTGAAGLGRSAVALAQSEDAHLAAQGPLRGQLDDLALAPGWSREPNTPGDAYPGAGFRACAELPVGDPRNPTAALDPEEREAQHRGWCNTGPGGAGTAYGPHRVQGRGWNDARLVRSAVFAVPVTVLEPGPCVVCVAAPLLDLPYAPEPAALPPEPGAHARTLGPGMYYLAGHAGVWHDAFHAHDESLFPAEPGSRVEAYGPDGWVGWVQRASGQWRYRGYEDRACATEQGPGLHTAAECNPYLDGNVEDPQDFAVHVGAEWRGACDPANVARAWLAPRDGSLDTQLLVWRHHEAGLNLDNGLQVEAYGPGPVPPLALVVHCLGGPEGRWRGADYLVWPEGNRGDAVRTWMEASITLGLDLDHDGFPDADAVRDEDSYAAWGAP